MAMKSGASREPFQLSMLFNDSRYRARTIQVFAFIILVLAATWLLDNTIRNLAALGKDFSFGFLWSTAGYDISPRAIDYSSTSSHARAALVGLLNTLIVAAMACVTATILGVFAGVLRLSNNWVVARLMTVYVESFRNVPALLWIIVVAAVMSEAMPAPNAFRGENPRASMVLWDSVAVTNRGIYLPVPDFTRSLGQAELALGALDLNDIAILGVLSLSFLIHRGLVKHAQRVQSATGRRPITWWKSLCIFALPMVALLYALGFHLDYPALKGLNFTGGLQLRNSFIALWIGLSVYTGAFIAEIVRSGILAISRGQTEAALALGLSPARTMRLVILPQALRIIIPPLISQYLNITKNTSLGLAVGYMDLRSTLGGITINQTGRELEGMLLMMLTYVAISLSISVVMNIYNDRVRLQER
ncbi:amino acid ABC transporter permease [Sinorhizobium americanum]|uniref:Glutamate/glutamine/aspartate/asparagine transport system permease protein bztB n=1 Tax=Sinorhizobium americanum TaxID=194963 RepID=A0A1L3LQ81_9HYPH|nr:ABC transporter permease subunit [Sinorhizobium americanum]APG92206.1 glutamate/glutamine/aspartate/asparagine transport system permease protein bztB [Sinorhizobium americanum]OAP34655.1 amino acid ABC transporter permease [Sinorhizobium americanum]